MSLKYIRNSKDRKTDRRGTQHLTFLNKNLVSANLVAYTESCCLQKKQEA